MKKKIGKMRGVLLLTFALFLTACGTGGADAQSASYGNSQAAVVERQSGSGENESTNYHACSGIFFTAIFAITSRTFSHLMFSFTTFVTHITVIYNPNYRFDSSKITVFPIL